jgi:exopolyphosphatase/guanosine-5'-triphosphate,3'-diphosphate pyrophosphatase
LVAPVLLVDLGGGSTELVLGIDGVDALRAHSMDIGSVRMTERHLISDPPAAAEIAAAEDDIRAAIDGARASVPLREANAIVAVAGTVTTVAAIALELTEYDAAKIHGSRIPAAAVSSVTEQLLGMNHEQRAAIRVIHPGRVDVIAAGALVLRTVLAEVGADELIVSEHDILDGIANSLF